MWVFLLSILWKINAKILPSVFSLCPKIPYVKYKKIVEMGVFLFAYVQVIIIICLIMRLQYRVWFGLDLGLGIKVGDPDVNKYVSSLTKVTLY